MTPPERTNVVGIDLAWSDAGRGRTGLCVVRDGEVVSSGVVRTDDEIVEWVTGRLDGGPWLFAVDAPVIVRNPDGRRPCERELSARFARHHAGAHSSNLGRPGFRGGSRAERLAARLGARISPDPPAGGGRWMVEVYPHPALVTLFGLARTLGYKARRGRSLETRRAEFLRLLGYVESLARARPPLDVTRGARWGELRRAVTGAATGAALDRVEDEVDAYVCAYVGLVHAALGRSGSRVYGDLETGFIVVPLGPVAAEPPPARGRGRARSASRASRRGARPTGRAAPDALGPAW